MEEIMQKQSMPSNFMIMSPCRAPRSFTRHTPKRASKKKGRKGKTSFRPSLQIAMHFHGGGKMTLSIWKKKFSYLHGVFFLPASFCVYIVRTTCPKEVYFGKHRGACVKWHLLIERQFRFLYPFWKQSEGKAIDWFFFLLLLCFYN